MGSSSSPPPSDGFLPDLATRRLMSVNEKRELVRKLSKCQLSAPEQLQEWTRCEISDVLCAELGKKGKENTFSSIPKRRMIALLFKAVNGESPYPRKYKKRKSKPELNAFSCPLPFKRQRKNGTSSLLPVMARTSASTGVCALTNNAELCQNSACRATINPGDKFCKRCSCCICFKYDDDKDPTLWLFCNSDQPLQEDSCGFSCHLECAIEDERSGIQKSGQSKKLDSAYYCTQCGKQNDLLGCLERQLSVAKNARRLDMLCHRIFLSHKILISTKKYLVLHDIVDTAMKKLEAEVGPITGIGDMGHGLVCRLPVGAEVQKLCLCAMEAVQSLFSCSLTADLQIQRSCITPCSLPTSKSRTSNIGDVGEAKVCGVEKSPGPSAAAFDEEQEIPRSIAQADSLRNSSSLMVYNRGILKQNLDMIFTGSEIPTRAYTKNMLVDPPENQSLLDTIPERTENHKGDSGKSFDEAKSGDHVPQDRYLMAETDTESSSRFEDTRHENGPADSSTAVQTSLHRESSNLMPNDRETFKQTLNADAARLENSSEAHNENELACKKTGDDMKSGNGISATSSNLKTCNHIPETGPSHIQREAIAYNQADQVNQLNKRVEEASLAFELEKSIVEKNTLESDMLTEELKIREEHLMPAPDSILSNFTRLQSFAHQIQAEVIRMEKGNPSVEDILGGMDAQIRVLEARILMIGSELENSARDAIERLLRDFLVKIRVLCPEVDVQNLVPELRDGDYRKVCDEIQPIVVELSKKLRLVTVNCGGDPGNILEEVKSGDHVLQNGCLKAETDPRCSSCKKSSRRFEDGEHESGPADPNMTVQTTLHRVSSHLMLNSRDTFQQNLIADAASLENASDVPSEHELVGSQQYYGSPLPITENNEIRSDKGISATGSELKAYYDTAQNGPLKPETEPESSSNKSLSGKPEEIGREDGHPEASCEYCVKVIRRLECEGYIEASFRVKFLTWFCLQAAPRERRIVRAYVDTLIGDPASLAAQLADTFPDAAYNKRPHRAPPGFCWQLWH